jgi:hypothetical protein
MLLNRKTTMAMVVVVVLVALAGCNAPKSAEPASAIGSTRDAIGSVTLTVTPGTTQYAGAAGPAVAVDPNLTVTGSATVTGASVSIGTGFVTGQDQLLFTTIGTITGSYDSVRGTLTLSGTGTLAEYQTALRSVTYNNYGLPPTPGNRTVSISLGTGLSNPANGHFYEYVSANLDWTSAKAAVASRTYLGLQGYLATITSQSENDFIKAKLASDGWIGAQASQNTLPNRTWSWANGPESGQQFCTNPSAGAWSISNGLYANWASGEPNAYGGNEGCGQIYVAGGTWNDLPCTVNTQAGYVAEYGGMAGDPVLTLSGTRTVNVAYTATALAATGTTLSYTQGDPATIVDPGLSVTGTSTYGSATVTITSGYVSGEDVLAMPTANGFSGSYSSGILSISGVGTPADFQAAMRTVTYVNQVSPRPTTAARTVAFRLGGVSASRSVQVLALPLVTVSSSNASAPLGSSVTLTATLTPLASTGSVQFFADGTSLGTVALSSGVASVATSSLALGTHSISAQYAGDAQRLSASGLFSQTITTIANGSGPCTSGNAATTCSSGLCNTTTSTCGGAVQSACASASQCAGNVCNNGLCGYANGSGSCTSGTAGICQSGTCSASGTCVPATNGCALTSDCAANDQCNTGTFTCERSLGVAVSNGTTSYDAAGAAVAIDAQVSVVGAQNISGATVTVGTNFEVGDQLHFTNQLGITGSYDATKGLLTLTGTTTTANYQTALASVTYTSSKGTPSTLLRTITFAIGTGVSYQANSHFYEYVSGGSWTWSQAQTAAAARTYYGLHGYLATIGTTDENAYVSSKLNGAGWMGASSTSTQGLPSFPRVWSWVTGPEAGTAFCNNPSSGSCTGIAGAYTDWNSGEPNNAGNEYRAQFLANGLWNDLSDTATLTGYVVEYGGLGTDPVLVLNASKSLQVRAVSALPVTSSKASSALHEAVTFTAHLTPSSATGTVQFSVDGVAVGSAIPVSAGVATSAAISDLALGNHPVSAAYSGDSATQAGTGSLSGGQTVNPLANGVGPCTQANGATDCAAMVCSGAGTCGYGNGEGPCSAATAGAICQSGTCSAGGNCMPGGGCDVDADCSGAQYCEQSTFTCHAKLAAGVAISNDGLHDGTCSAGNSSAVCASGACNAATNTCATGLSTACTNAAQCTTNACAPSGSCVPAANGCAVTADCAAGNQCNVGALTCEVAPNITASAGTTGYDALTADVPVDAAISVVGAPTVTGATVTIGTGFVAAQDRLVFVDGNGITGSYSQASGVLTLTGSATSAAYQAALRSVLYRNVGGAFPSTALKTVTFGLGTAVANNGNGHFYEYVASNGTWVAAKAAAEARTYLGLKGYLATITSAAENAFVTAKLTQDGWIGAQANPQTSFPRTWSWVSGPEAGTAFCSNPSAGACAAIANAYQNWNPGEPNNAGGEGCGQIYFQQGGRWNDLSCAGTNLSGYVVEYGGTANDPVLTLNTSKDLQVRAATALALSSSQPGSALHAGVSFTATLSPSTATGHVQFAVDGVDVGAAIAVSNGAAISAALSTLSLGGHAITASYDGDAQDQPASGTLAGGQTIVPLGNGVGPCTQANGATDCAAGVCSASGTCGFGNTEGPCMTATASAVCQSGFCSAGGVCIATTPGACYVDGDCSAAQYCERSSATCQAKLAAGVAIASDTLHDGLCSPSAAAAVCATGACNPFTNTCSVASGLSCTAASQCTTNACSSSGRCVPAASGSCWSDQDCTSAQFCDHQNWVCAARLPGGAPIPNDGLHDGVCSAGTALAVCVTGLCNPTTNTCAGATGATCASSGDCEYGTCSHGRCGFSNGEAGCTASTTYLCQSGACSVSGTCIGSAPGSCWVDTDCAHGTYCDRPSASCVPQGAPGTALPADGALHTGVCSVPLATAVCASGTCNAATNTCAASNTQGCTQARDCVSNVCGTNHECGQAAGDGPCTVDGGVSSCQSGVCDPLANGTTSACVPSATGCWVDAECAAGQYCLRSVFTCTAAVVPGGALPGDGLHTACPASGVNGACGTGLCNVQTNTCAAANGAACTKASECATNACGSNGTCGLADGQPGCTVATQASCQSGACSASGTCMPAGGCWADADCGAMQYCDRASSSCTVKLLVGAAIPSDGLHDGHCGAGGTSPACASGVCNSTANTCAAAVTFDCASAAQCTDNVCGTNGKCGLANGQPGCTAASAGNCQSGSCSASGACVPFRSDGCWADADCAANQHCDRGTFTCVADLAAGQALPDDTLHAPVCSAPVAQSVCSAGLCNPVSNTCASANGVACAGASECAVGVCGANHTCGLANGQSCSAAMADQCQSATCKGNTCVPAKGCWADADCSADAYCRRDTGVCHPREVAGTALPDDGLHDPNCTPASGVAICATGQCSVFTNTCAAVAGETCTTASQCTDNVCASDGRCGQVDGAVCVSSAECRGECVNGVCGAAVVNKPQSCACSSGADLGAMAWLALAGLLAASRRRAR